MMCTKIQLTVQSLIIIIIIIIIIIRKKCD